MPKAILSFNLPEEQEAFDHAREGDSWRYLVCLLDAWLREQIKYHGGKELQGVRDQLYTYLEEEGLSL